VNNTEIDVPAALDGERLDRVVAMVTGVSRAVAAALVDGGFVEVDGTVERSVKRRVSDGARVRVELPANDVAGVQADPSVVVDVVYEDADVVVVDKPPGVVVHPGAGNPTGTLVNGLLARFPEIAGVGDPARPGIVHRLDKGTSGLLVVARSPAAYGVLVDQLAHRSVERRYTTLVWGKPEPATGVIDAPVGRSARDPTRMAVSSRGRDARTHYHVERAYRSPALVTLLDCRLETGRTHQVRVHLAAIHHPVVGDGRYGGKREPIAAPRPLLHARALSFAHPVSGARVAVESALPEDFRAVLATLTD
jgi:23S rRNA pseudouridine1911/1915/1917 synthase